MFFGHFAKTKKEDSKLWSFGQFLKTNQALAIYEKAGLIASERILEIGPGHGAMAKLCINIGNSYYAVEPNSEMAGAVEALGAKAVYRVIAPSKDLSGLLSLINYNAVLLINLIEHMDSQAKASELVQDIYNYLPICGQIVIVAPDYKNWGSDFYNCDYTHNYVTTPLRLRQLLSDVGFSNVKSSTLPAIYGWGTLGNTLARLITLFRIRNVDLIYRFQLFMMKHILVTGIKWEERSWEAEKWQSKAADASKNLSESCVAGAE